jgi:hypothetical protein
MTAAADVKNLDGMLLIPAGGVLGERQIGILQAWGIEAIEVEACPALQDDISPLAQLSPETVAQLTGEIRSRFWTVDDPDPVFAEILKQLLVRRASQREAMAS